MIEMDSPLWIILNLWACAQPPEKTQIETIQHRWVHYPIWLLQLKYFQIGVLVFTKIPLHALDGFGVPHEFVLHIFFAFLVIKEIILTIEKKLIQKKQFLPAKTCLHTSLTEYKSWASISSPQTACPNPCSPCRTLRDRLKVQPFFCLWSSGFSVAKCQTCNRVFHCFVGALIFFWCTGFSLPNLSFIENNICQTWAPA